MKNKKTEVKLTFEPGRSEKSVKESQELSKWRDEEDTAYYCEAWVNGELVISKK